MNAARRTRIHEAMLRFADGDRSAIDPLLDELWPVVLAFAQRGVGRGADAEDVAQEVFFKICSRIGEFDATRDGLSWAFGIASYEVMTMRQRQRRRREVPDTALAHAADAAVTQEQILLERELLLALEQAMGALAEVDRQALAPTFAAVKANASPAHRKRKQRALGRLKALWRSIYGEA
jgi:RNA polymerase sigma factor (sigma-70 family)